MKLVVGVADDATSIDAVAYAATLAKTFEAHVTLVTVSATADEYINDHLDPRMGQGRSDEQARLVDGLAEVYPAPLLTVRTLDDLNHLFQPARTGEVDEYLTIDTTFDPAALAALTDWLAALPAR